MKRVLFDILLFISVFTLPWWVSMILLLIGIFKFKNFYEFIIAIIFMYSLFRTDTDLLISSPYFVLSVAFVFYIGVQYLKSNMIAYK